MPSQNAPICFHRSRQSTRTTWTRCKRSKLEISGFPRFARRCSTGRRECLMTSRIRTGKKGGARALKTQWVIDAKPCLSLSPHPPPPPYPPRLMPSALETFLRCVWSHITRYYHRPWCSVRWQGYCHDSFFFHLIWLSRNFVSSRWGTMAAKCVVSTPKSVVWIMLVFLPERDNYYGRYSIGRCMRIWYL